MNLSNLQYVSDEEGKRITVIVPIELWEELTREKGIDATAELLNITGFERGSHSLQSKQSRSATLAHQRRSPKGARASLAVEAAFKQANQQVEEGKTKDWRSIRDDV